MRRFAAALLLVAAACGTDRPGSADAKSAADSAAPSPGEPARSPETVDSLAAILAESGGTVGVAALHVESGRRVSVEGGRAFAMASTFKLPVALAVLARVDGGTIRLADTVRLAPSDFRLGPGQVIDSVGRSGGVLTVADLVRSMLVYSDNTATDRLLTLVGGPAAVNAHLRARGISGIRVDRSEGEVHWQYAGVRDVPPRHEWTLEDFERRTAAVPAAQKDSAHRAYFADPRDTGTPDAFVRLLAQVQRGEGISAASRAFLLAAMRESPTGAARIRGLLPEGTEVADKTGTIGGSTNDAGLVTLPDGSHLALAVFVTQSARPTEDEERIVARAARAVYAHFARAPQH